MILFVIILFYNVFLGFFLFCFRDYQNVTLFSIFQFCIAYFTPNCTWSLNYSVIVLNLFSYGPMLSTWSQSILIPNCVYPVVDKVLF
jgi:hypothetical protein